MKLSGTKSHLKMSYPKKIKTQHKDADKKAQGIKA